MNELSHDHDGANTGRSATLKRTGARANGRGHSNANGARGELDAPKSPTPAVATSGDPWSVLIVRVAEHRDQAAFRDLFERFAPRLKAYLLKQGVVASQAEELSQEAMLSVWRKASYFDPNRATAAAWIFTVARNLRIDAYRHGRVAVAYDLDPLNDQNEPPAPDSILLSGERGRKIEAAINGLPSDQVDVIRSSFFQDKPHAQIAEDLRLPLGTVKSRIRTALFRMKKLLGDGV